MQGGTKDLGLAGFVLRIPFLLVSHASIEGGVFPSEHDNFYCLANISI